MKPLALTVLVDILEFGGFVPIGVRKDRAMMKKIRYLCDLINTARSNVTGPGTTQATPQQDEKS